MTPRRSRTISDYTPLEVASGFPSGTGALPALERHGGHTTARRALEAAVLPALLRPPCAVAFSGGRDSSAVLAVAAHVARREGLPPPVPVSLVFPGASASAESDWQELVVRHLRLADRVQLTFADELDSVGPYADRVLRQHGLLFPHNAHLLLPVLDAAPGGALLTGVGGDEVLLPATHVRVNRLLAGQVRPRPRDALALAAAHGPRSLRVRRLARRHRYDLPWLRPGARRQLTRMRAELLADEEVAWDRWLLRSWWTNRSRVLAAETVSRLAEDHGSLAVQPLQDPGFLRAVGAEAGSAGFASRTRAMRALFGDLLPAEVVARRDKATFNQVFWGAASRRLVADWDGGGVDHDLVDPEALRTTWQADVVDGRSKWLLQSLRLRELRPYEL